MTPEEIMEIGLYQDPKNPNIFSDMEDLVFNIKSKELFYHSCLTGHLDLVRKVKDIEDLKMAIYDAFPFNRNDYNLD